MSEMIDKIQKELFELQDLSYKAFQSNLMPTIDKNMIIGVRTPNLRKMAGYYAKREEAKAFMRSLPHKYYEENNLHAFLIEKRTDFDQCMDELDKFLSYVDNWATCDSMSPKVLRKNPEKLKAKIWEWIHSEEIYRIRFGIVCLMKYYLDEQFSVEYLEWVAKIVSEEYYVQMAQAWFFATALAKRYDETVPYLEEHKISCWVHNKTIQKAVESYRISAKQKHFLKTLKRK